jgi:hypothetical protein
MWSIQQEVKMFKGIKDVLGLDQISVPERNLQIVLHDREDDAGDGLQLQVLVEQQSSIIKGNCRSSYFMRLSFMCSSRIPYITNSSMFFAIVTGAYFIIVLLIK